jgi:serine/threonine protein kinase
VRALERNDPRAVGRYRILARIDAGGMAVIYFGRSPGGRAVAVKVMHAELAAEPEYRARFRREVAATRAAGGRYSPSVLDADSDAGIPWLATEFLPSVSLRDAVRQLGPLRADSVWPLAAGLVEALASIHRAGIVHLDLNPGNVLLTADGPRVIDFGIAVETRSGLVALGGTPAGTRGFMPPEQVAGVAVGAASDVFSFGATLAYACTGPQQSGEALTGIADDPLRTVIADCLRPDPTARPTVPELADRLASVTRERLSGTAWLPPVVTAEIDRRAGAAENPPIALPVPPADVQGELSPGPAPAPGPRISRRTLLLSGGSAIAVVGGTGGVLTFLPDEPEPEPSTAQPQPSRTPASPAVTPAATPKTRTLEFYAFGTARLKSLTTVVNGQAVTVRNVPLPYRRTVEIPQWPEPSTWRIDYHHTTGNFRCVVSVDGSYGGGASSSSTGGDHADSRDGVV